MFNVLYEILPTEWEGYQLNTWFQIGIQIYVVMDDEEISEYEKNDVIVALLFGEEDGSIRDHPEGEELGKCLDWFLNGWNHDNPGKIKNTKKIMDLNKDQWRIYADFIHIYHINLNEADMHWWEFSALLWNMPFEDSQFLQVIDIRKKEIDPKMSSKEKQRMADAKQVYALTQPAKEYTKEEESKIDEVDRLMAQTRKQKE